MESNLNRSNEKHISENDDERIKCLTETMEKLRISIDSYKNRLQAVTREKHDIDLRYTQLNDEHQNLKTRFEDVQTKFRSNDQQLRQVRLSNEQLNQELAASRRLSDQQSLILNSKSQDSLKRITLELDRALQRINDYKRFINALLHEMIRRSVRMTEHLRRTREQQKQRESLSTTLPGYDTAMSTASRILNLTQDDLDEIMSVTDKSFPEECSGKLVKIFSKKLDKIKAADQELSLMRNA